MRPRCWLPRRRRQLEHNQCHGPFNFFSHLWLDPEPTLKNPTFLTQRRIMATASAARASLTSHPRACDVAIAGLSFMPQGIHNGQGQWSDEPDRQSQLQSFAVGVEIQAATHENKNTAGEKRQHAGPQDG